MNAGRGGRRRMTRLRVILVGWFLLILTGIALARESEPLVRIGLGTGLSSIDIGFPDGGELLDERGRLIRKVRAGDRFDWSLAAEASSRKGRDRRRKRAPSMIGRTIVARARRGGVAFAGTAWRGTLELRLLPSGATVINCVGLEEYVRGVVGGEMGSMSPPESLKAQAVIARTFVLANRGKHGKEGYDLCRREHCQVYGGSKAERATVNAAVDGTRGVIMIGEGSPISTLYHSTCGGMTSDNDLVFGGAPRSYLRRVKCPFCRSGINFRWTRRIPVDLLRRKMAGEKIVFTRLFGAETRAEAPLDRVQQLILTTDRGTFSLKGTTVRRLFNLPSTTFTAQPPSGLPTLRESPSGERESEPGGSAVVRSLHSDQKAGPEQMILLTGQGVRRVKRPEGGWKVLVSSLPDLDTSKSRGIPLRKALLEFPELVLMGRGYGHQVGLCQAGAIDQGRRGWSYRQILPYYYTGVLLRRLGY